MAEISYCLRFFHAKPAKQWDISAIRPCVRVLIFILVKFSPVYRLPHSRLLNVSFCAEFLHCMLAKFSGAVYCNRSCLWVGLWLCLFVCLWVCYHDNSKLRASILTKLGLLVKVVTLSS